MEFSDSDYSDDSDQYYMSMYDSDSYSDDYDYDDDDDDQEEEEEEEEGDDDDEESCYDSEEDDDNDSDEDDDEYDDDDAMVSYRGEEICCYDSDDDDDDDSDDDDDPPVTFLVFDLETTGLDGIDNRIIEMAIMDMNGGGGDGRFYSLVNPGCPVTNSYIHGITNNMVNRPHVPRMQQLIPNMLRFVRSRQKPGGYVVWVAHNARSFDVPFLANEFRRCSTPIPSNWLFLDTLPLAYQAMKNAGSQMGWRVSLQALREYYGIQLTGSAHSAMSDVHCLSEVLKRIVFDLNLSIDDLLQMTFRIQDLGCRLLS